MNTKTVHDARARYVAIAVRDRLVYNAVTLCRHRIEAAGGNWPKLRRGCWAAIYDYLTHDPSALPIIQYHAAAQTMPDRLRGRASVALGNATRRALRAIGPQLPYLAHARAMDTVCEALGESDPVVVKMRGSGVRH